MTGKINLITRLAILVFMSVILSPAATAGRIITVDDDGLADFNNIQAAINDANDGDIIEVQPGIYTGDGNRDIEFLGKRITVRSIDPGDPDIVAATVIDCNGTEIENHRGFCFDSYVWWDAVLAGLTIKNGYHELGGAIYCHGASPIFNNLHIQWCSADAGGGIYCEEGSWPIINNCLFAFNSSTGSGGGLLACLGSSLKINHCRFEGNRAEGTDADSGGGGIFSVHSDLEVKNCVFAGNSAVHQGGGFCIFLGTGRVTNCTFHNNSASEDAGAVFISGCFAEHLRVRNCIIWDNEPNDDTGVVVFPGGTCDPPQVNIDFSILQSNWPGGTGIIISDPCFADAANGDYHLKSQAGRWDPNSKSWVQDTATSPAIDAGDPLDPVGYELFPNGGIINMGAYGGTVEASKSYFGEPVCETIVAGDINGDCKVDFLDFRLTALHWLEANNP